MPIVAGWGRDTRKQVAALQAKAAPAKPKYVSYAKHVLGLQTERMVAAFQRSSQ